MSINAIAKKKLGFRNGDTGEILTVEPLVYSTLPDWIKNDPMYGWAVNDGSLEVTKDGTEEVKDTKPKKTKNDGSNDGSEE